MSNSLLDLLLPEALPASDYALYSLHATQMSFCGGPWQACPPRLFLQLSEAAPIVALCASGNLYPTASYDQARFQLGEQVFADRQALLAFLTRQNERLTQALTQTGAVQLTPLGEVRSVEPENGTDFTLNELQQLVGAGYIDILRSFEQGPYAGHTLVIDDNGKIDGQPINPLATRCWFETYPLGRYFPVDVVAGTVLLVRDSLLGD